jgi:two-component system, sensor histidine kinase
VSRLLTPLRALASSGRTLRKLLAPSVVFVLGLCVTIAATLATFKSITAAERARFERLAGTARDTLYERLNADVDAMRAAAGLFATTGELTQGGFERFIRHLSPAWLRRTRTVGWAPRVTTLEATGWTDSVLGLNAGGFEITPPGRRAEYFPVLYVHPSRGRAIDRAGFDVGAEPRLRTAMDRAATVGDVATSEILSTNSDERGGVFYLFYPVFSPGAALETAAERQGALQGFVFTTLDADTLTDHISLPESLAMSVGTSDVRSLPVREVSLTEVEGSFLGHPVYRTTRAVGIGDRVWTVNFASTRAFAAATPWSYLYLTALGALLITLLLTGVTWSEARARAEAEQTNLRLAESEDALRRANRAKDEFLGMVSHELRNPLGAMAGALKILRLRGNLTDNAAVRALDVAERQVRHQSRLVDDLLDVTRLATSNILLDVRPIDLHALLARAVASVRHLAAEQHHLLTLTRPEKTVIVDGDTVRLEQVICNLLTNSIKYTPKGGLIEVELACAEERAIIRVRDDGAGIPTELIDHVFSPFYQERLGTSANKGLGLGLTIAQRLVALHGGQISVKSAGRDLGTEFVVELPLSSAAVSEAIPVEASALAEDGAAACRDDATRARVLVIDDMDDGRQILRDLLEALDVEVFDAGTGMRGVELVQQIAPDLALIDIDLPDIDGFEVARRIRAMRSPNSRTMLVAITGYGAAEDKSRAMSTGFDDYLVKPIDMTRLTTLLGGLSAPPPPAESTQRLDA